MSNIDALGLVEKSVKMKKLIRTQAKEWNVDISFVDMDRFLIYCLGGSSYIQFSSREERSFSTLQKELGIEGECQ